MRLKPAPITLSKSSNMQTSSILSLAALFFGAFSSQAFLQAQTVAWGTSASANPLAFNSDGAVDNATNIWNLGYFDDTYTPDATNWNSWAANWNTVATSTHQNWGGAFWAVSVNTYDVGSAAAGKQMYVFAYNDLSKIGTPEGEALIYRQDGLLFPGVADQETFDVANNPMDTDDDAFTVIWGRVDREMYADANDNDGILRGGGIISSLIQDSNATPYDQGNGTFEVQFATWAVIPEPSAALLGGIGLLLLLRRRR